jgi:hypothetical protein
MVSEDKSPDLVSVINYSVGIITMINLCTSNTVSNVGWLRN